jgi:hypothetical protein
MKRYLETFFKTLDKIPHNTAILSSYLNSQGIPYDIQYNYKNKKWIQSIGQGAFIKFGNEQISFTGAVYTLQSQTNLKLHIGGLSALILNGQAHYIRVTNLWQLFGVYATKLPKWFKNYNFGEKEQWSFYTTSFLPDNADDFIEYDCKTYKIKISNSERAIFEALYLAPDIVGLDELSEIFDLLYFIRPTHIQRLLETCKSAKVKRLFLYLAQKANIRCFKYLNLTKVDLGRGILSINKSGNYNKKYNIVIKELSSHYTG